MIRKTAQYVLFFVNVFAALVTNNTKIKILTSFFKMWKFVFEHVFYTQTNDFLANSRELISLSFSFFVITMQISFFQYWKCHFSFILTHFFFLLFHFFAFHVIGTLC